MQKPQRTDSLAFRKLGTNTVIIELGGVRNFHDLNEPASFIWEFCDGQNSVEAIAQKLEEEFEIDSANALADTKYFLATLEEKKLIHYS